MNFKIGDKVKIKSYREMKETDIFKKILHYESIYKWQSQCFSFKFKRDYQRRYAIIVDMAVIKNSYLLDIDNCSFIWHSEFLEKPLEIMLNEFF